jgi:prophage antirepressor-like protein
MTNKLQLFEGTTIRTVWDNEKEEWFFSVADVCNVLSGSQSKDPNAYWRKLKQRLKAEGSEVVTNCHGLKLEAADGKKYLTDVLSTRDILRLIQSIPSPKAEPLKMWLAQVGSERLDEIADPEKAIMRAADTYRAKGYSDNWINQRLQSIEMRKELTDEWKTRGIELEQDYAILTNEMTRAWSGMSVRQYKDLKGLKKENLRDNMTNLELVLNMLAEVTTTTISRSRKPETFEESRKIAKEGGSVARDTRRNIESRIGQSVISATNAQDKLALDVTIPAIEQAEIVEDITEDKKSKNN